MYADKQKEVEAGTLGEIITLTIFYNEYVLKGHVDRDLGRQTQIVFTKQDPYADMDYAMLDMLLPPPPKIVAYVEVKDRYISSEDYRDMVCPTRKAEFASCVEQPCYMVQRYTDSAWLINLKTAKPFKQQYLRRLDADIRGDRENILHNYYSLSDAIRL